MVIPYIYPLKPSREGKGSPYSHLTQTSFHDPDDL